MINYRLLGEASEFYSSMRYMLLDVPWAVSDEACDATMPADARKMSTFMGNLVGSGEQSFLQMLMDGRQLRGKYHCITPCFRDEAKHDAYTKPWFVKLELINIGGTPDDVDEMLRHAMSFYRHAVPRCEQLRLVETDLGHDICVGNVEVGSYGFRSHGDFRWVYGTGLAEPRFSAAVAPYTRTDYDDEFSRPWTNNA